MNEGRRRGLQRPQPALAPGKRSAQAWMGSRAGEVRDGSRKGETPKVARCEAREPDPASCNEAGETRI